MKQPADTSDARKIARKIVDEFIVQRPQAHSKRGKKYTIDTKMEQMHFSVRMYSFNVHGSLTIIADTLALR